MTLPVERYDWSAQRGNPPFTLEEKTPPDWIRRAHITGTFVLFNSSLRERMCLDSFNIEGAHMSLQFPNVRNSEGKLFSVEFVAQLPHKDEEKPYTLLMMPWFGKKLDMIVMKQNAAKEHIITIPGSENQLAYVSMTHERPKISVQILRYDIPIQCIVRPGSTVGFSLDVPNETSKQTSVLLRDYNETRFHGRHTALQFGDKNHRSELLIEDSLAAYALKDKERTLCSLFLGNEKRVDPFFP